ncbi:hypothetical protein ASD44_00885 [Mesorhizobium sp. Root554]|uniref:hypothetical protein n=1 Tax=unclassified Mesorhizobium TaxID=325217 RepID=UPI0006FD9D39|nr:MULTISPECIES: hypothetical protein [unclassified Mesorhizobium]KQZ12777.1 hypothetical protein ASD27_00885 [Mesorhizobium sp. Root1471]KQZ35299.1 hypothetical protein ASD44_00885 [Mesorhizobium sp. Root554]
MKDTFNYTALHEDPMLAFIQLVEHFDTILETDAKGMENEDTRRFLISHMNSIIGAARELGILAISQWTLPEYDDTYGEHARFDLAVKSIVLQARIRHSRTVNVYSVQLSLDDKNRIHSLVGEIRQLLERANLDIRKKNSLFAKLNAFEADVDRIRTRFDNALLAFLAVAHVANKGTDALKPINELLKRIKDVMGAAKEDEPEQAQLPPSEDINQIEKPRKQIGGPEATREMDEEVPF